MTEHFEKVRELIWGARTDFQNIGYALGLDPATVKEIKDDNRDTGDRFVAVLTLAFQKGLTRSKLADALDSTTVHHGRLAKKVRSANFPCKLFNAVCNEIPKSHLNLNVSQATYSAWPLEFANYIIIIMSNLSVPFTTES